MDNKCKVLGYKNLLFFNGFKGGDLNWSIEDRNELCAEGIANKPFDEGQLGCVFKIDSMVFNQEAVDILKNIKKSGDDIGDVDIYSYGKDKFYLAWLGGPMSVKNANVEGSSSYDPSPLDNVTVIDCEIPRDIIDYCNNSEADDV